MSIQKTMVALALMLVLGWFGWRWIEAPKRDDGIARVGVEPMQARPAAAVAPASTPSAGAGPTWPAPPTTAAVATIGPEGYAPLIRRAIDSGGAREASEAVELMNTCRHAFDIEAALRGSHRWVTKPLLPAPQLAKAVESLRLHQQRCQTVTPDLLAQRESLARRALEGQWPGAPKLLADIQAEAGPRDEEREHAEFMEAVMLAINRWNDEQP